MRWIGMVACATVWLALPGEAHAAAVCGMAVNDAHDYLDEDAMNRRIAACSVGDILKIYAYTDPAPLAALYCDFSSQIVLSPKTLACVLATKTARQPRPAP